ncbi:MAG TPA: hypothetical protein VKU94_07695 [Geobacterales bacterium]|nr:hypothetical protein [Geobacterales bacterium]
MKVLSSFPSSILILPQIDFDEDGSITSLSTVSLNLNYRVHAEAEKDDDLKLVNCDIYEKLFETIKNELNLGGARITVSIEKKFDSLNQNVSILLSIFDSYLRLYGLDFKEYLKIIEDYLMKRRASFLLPSSLLYNNFVFHRKSAIFDSIYELGMDISDYSLVIVELGNFDIQDFLKDKWYRKVISYHSNSSFEFFSNSMDLQSLYEANNKFAFQAGLLEPELEDLMKIAKNLGSEFVGYNFFSKAFHCLVRKENSVDFYERLIGLLSKNIKTSIISLL